MRRSFRQLSLVIFMYMRSERFEGWISRISCWVARLTTAFEWFSCITVLIIFIFLCYCFYLSGLFDRFKPWPLHVVSHFISGHIFIYLIFKILLLCIIFTIFNFMWYLFTGFDFVLVRFFILNFKIIKWMDRIIYNHDQSQNQIVFVRLRNFHIIQSQLCPYIIVVFK